MAYGKRLLIEPIRTIAAASVPAAYSIANTLQSSVASGSLIALEHPSRAIMIDNDTNQNLMFSIDGINDHVWIHSQSSKVLDIGTNKESADGAFFLGNGEVLYVRHLGSAPTTGDVWYTPIYAKGD